MIGKPIVGGSDRRQAIENLRKSLRRFVIEGISSNLDLHKEVCCYDDYLQNRLGTKWLETTILPTFVNQKEKQHGAY